MAPQLSMDVSNAVAYGDADLGDAIRSIETALAAIETVLSDYHLSDVEREWLAAIPDVTWRAIRDALVAAWEQGWTTSLDVVYRTGANFHEVSISTTVALGTTNLGVVLTGPPPANLTTSA